MNKSKSRLFKHLSFVIFLLVVLFMTLSLQAQDKFIKGINLNGNAVIIDGNPWVSFTSALNNGFSTTTVNSFSNNITWSPSVDANTNMMLNSVIYKSGGSFTMNQKIANGNYKVYLWLMENYSDFARSEDIRLEGLTVATGIGKMAKNSWVKYGPYSVTVKDGVLTIDFIRISGDPQCAGLAIFSTDSISSPIRDG